MNRKAQIENIVESLEKDPIAGSALVYHPIPLEGLEHLKTSSNRESAFHKWKLISNSFDIKKEVKVVLDVGANAGFYTYQLSKLGISVDAFENNKRYLELGRKISNLFNFNVNWSGETVTDELIVKRDKYYDLTLMLSVFQWITRGNIDLEMGCRLLREVSKRTKYLVFELGCNTGNSAIEVKGDELCHLEWISKLLHDNTDFSNIVPVGIARAWGDKARFIFVCSNRPIRRNLLFSSKIILQRQKKRLSKMMEVCI
ncbi:hypothetical protein KKC91_02865 [bacterium]|nr:hypothetical protein [bacterium]